MTLEDDFEAWINSFHDFVSPDDGVIITMRKPDDIIKVAKVLGEIYHDD
jgi:hypothetical protein